MKKMEKIISIICCIFGVIISLYGLIVSLQSIGTDGWEKLGVIFIIPSVIALIVTILDLLITVDKIKRGLIYSCISSLIKIGIIIYLIPSIISNYKYGVQYNVSNLSFELILITFLTIITIPSILNITKLISSKKHNK